jgi:cell division protein FtsB
VSDLYGDHRPSPHEGIWHSLNKFLLTLIVLSISIPIAYSFMPEVKKRKVDEARIEELKGQVEHQRMMLARLQREEGLLKHDPEYIGLIARDRLDLMKEGETIYRVDTVKLDTSKFRLNP